MQPLLSILIPTIVGRESQLESLIAEIKGQQGSLSDPSQIEIIYEKDNKELSIGQKRNRLYYRATGLYSVQIDDDDSIAPFYLQKAIEALQQTPDCVGYLEHCTMDGCAKMACHSNRFQKWGERIDGFDYVRTIFNKDIIRTEIAKQIKFQERGPKSRFGEDEDWSMQLKQSGLLQNEVFVNDIMLYYSHNTLTKREHKSRYGIR